MDLDVIKLLRELFNLLVVMVLGWWIDVKEMVYVDGDESAGDEDAADDTIYNFFPYSEWQSHAGVSSLLHSIRAYGPPLW